jgi:hypothetical protein
MSTTTNSNQETVLQETDSVVDVAQNLENFGIIKSVASRLIQHYPAAYIREKLAMAQELVAAGSRLVSQNPAGWLRKAIEEDYAPPRTSQRHRQRHIREKKDTKPAHPEPREQQMPKEESQQAQNVSTQSEQNVATERPQCPQTVSTQWQLAVPTLYRVSNTEKKEAEKTIRENETTWNLALEKLKADLPPGEAETRLNGTTLLQVTDTAARIGAPSAFAIAWLERRMYRQISKAMKGVLGKDLDLQFVAA